MKKLLLLFIFIPLFLYPDELKTIKNGSIIINYNNNDSLLYDSVTINKTTFKYIFFNKKDKPLELVFFYESDGNKILVLNTSKIGYFEIVYNKSDFSITIDKILGEYDFVIENTNMLVKVQSKNLSLENFISRYRCIFYPDNNNYIIIIEGKAKINTKSDSDIIIISESIFAGDNIEHTAIDYESAQIILLNKVLIRKNEIIEENNLIKNDNYPVIENEFIKLISKLR